MKTKISITVWIAAFILTSCIPANKNVLPETLVPTSTSILLVPPTLQATLTSIPALPKGVIFDKVYDEKNGAGAERSYSIISTIDGGFFIAGQPNYGFCSIHKLTSVGEEEWKYIPIEEIAAGEQCWLPRQITSGGYAAIISGADMHGVVNGGLPAIVSGDHMHGIVLKLETDGTRKSIEEFSWRSGMSPRLDNDGNLFWLSMFGLYGELIETLDHGYAVAGTLIDETLDHSMHLIRTDDKGNYLWERNLCRDKNVREEWQKKIVCSDRNLWDGIESQDGGFVILGRFPGIWLMKTDVDGNVEWMQTYVCDDGHAVIQTPDSGFLIAGAINKGGLLIKTDAIGNLQWQKIFRENQYGVFNKLIMDTNGNIIVIGSKQSNRWLLSIDLDNLE